MGDLPPSCVQNHRVFSPFDMDYSGPYLVKKCKRRNTKTTKVFIELFICITVKTVHIEIISDLTTDAFLAALDRFVTLHGILDNLYLAWYKLLRGWYSSVKNLLNDKGVQNVASSKTTCKWNNFISSPRCTHFGCLWEAKKFHLKRVIGTQLLPLNLFYLGTIIMIIDESQRII